MCIGFVIRTTVGWASHAFLVVQQCRNLRGCWQCFAFPSPLSASICGAGKLQSVDAKAIILIALIADAGDEGEQWLRFYDSTGFDLSEMVSETHLFLGLIYRFRISQFGVASLLLRVGLWLAFGWLAQRCLWAFRGRDLSTRRASARRALGSLCAMLS
jgi:hypothetical protein